MVSIIVPVYNAASFIGETISMVERQTYQDWELLLVDDASTDDSVRVIMDVIRKSPVEASRIHLLRKERNEGAAKARNTGVEAAHGRYICFLDADDIWQPQKLERELAFIRETEAAFVFTSYEFGDEAGRPTGRVVKAPDHLDFAHALSRTVIFTSTVMFDTEKLDKSRLRMPAIPSEDTALWWSLLKTGIVARGLNEVLVVYRRPAHSLSSDKKEAVRRIWRLYREIAGLGPVASAWHLIGWAFRATLRRL